MPLPQSKALGRGILVAPSHQRFYIPRPSLWLVFQSRHKWTVWLFELEDMVCHIPSHLAFKSLVDWATGLKMDMSYRLIILMTSGNAFLFLTIFGNDSSLISFCLVLVCLHLFCHYFFYCYSFSHQKCQHVNFIQHSPVTCPIQKRHSLCMSAHCQFHVLLHMTAYDIHLLLHQLIQTNRYISQDVTNMFTNMQYVCVCILYVQCGTFCVRVTM